MINLKTKQKLWDSFLVTDQLLNWSFQHRTSSGRNLSMLLSPQIQTLSHDAGGREKKPISRSQAKTIWSNEHHSVKVVENGVRMLNAHTSRCIRSCFGGKRVLSGGFHKALSGVLWVSVATRNTHTHTLTLGSERIKTVFSRDPHRHSKPPCCVEADGNSLT